MERAIFPPGWVLPAKNKIEMLLLGKPAAMIKMTHVG